MMGCALAWAQETTATVTEGVYTEEQAAHGGQLFQQSCALCHGANLGGLGEAPALIGAQFIGDFNGLTVGDLFERIRTTMPLNNPGGLTREEYAAILAFMLKSNGFKAGPRDLYSRTEFLNTIRFEPPAAAATH
jgi:S-disulfanyl-L-cysteine oxidoreductase SoxD